MAAAKNGQAETAWTLRVVLRRIPDELVADVEGDGECWEVLGTIAAQSKLAAIRELAKDEPGQYRAPSLRSWKGGEEVVLPDSPQPERRAID